jgi:hypothetical protein
MHLANYLGLLHKAELHLADAFRQVGDHHAAEPDVYQLSHTLAGQCEGHAEQLLPFVDRYGEDAPASPTGCSRSCSGAPARAGWGCCVTSRTCT